MKSEERRVDAESRCHNELSWSYLFWERKCSQTWLEDSKKCALQKLGVRVKNCFQRPTSFCTTTLPHTCQNASSDARDACGWELLVMEQCQTGWSFSWQGEKTGFLRGCKRNDWQSFNCQANVRRSKAGSHVPRHGLLQQHQPDEQQWLSPLFPSHQHCHHTTRNRLLWQAGREGRPKSRGVWHVTAWQGTWHGTILTTVSPRWTLFNKHAHAWKGKTSHKERCTEPVNWSVEIHSFRSGVAHVVDALRLPTKAIISIGSCIIWWAASQHWQCCTLACHVMRVVIFFRQGFHEPCLWQTCKQRRKFFWCSGGWNQNECMQLKRWQKLQWQQDGKMPREKGDFNLCFSGCLGLFQSAGCSCEDSSTLVSWVHLPDQKVMQIQSKSKQKELPDCQRKRGVRNRSFLAFLRRLGGFHIGGATNPFVWTIANAQIFEVTSCSTLGDWASKFLQKNVIFTGWHRTLTPCKNNWPKFHSGHRSHIWTMKTLATCKNTHHCWQEQLMASTRRWLQADNEISSTRAHKSAHRKGQVDKFSWRFRLWQRAAPVRLVFDWHQEEEEGGRGGGL